MRVIVIGAGIVGMSTAYWLNRHGIRVTVIEQRSGPAQEASFGTAGLVTPPFNWPTTTGRNLLRHWFNGSFSQDATVRIRPGFDAQQWRWLREWRKQSRSPTAQANRTASQVLSQYSAELLQQQIQKHELDIEWRQGVLELVDTRIAPELIEQKRQHLEALGLSHQWLDAQAATRHDPALQWAVEREAPLAGAFYYPKAGSGNCPLHARLLASHLEAAGVEFVYGRQAEPITSGTPHITGVVLEDGSLMSAEAVVVATATLSDAVLKLSQHTVPILEINGYAANVPLHLEGASPQQAWSLFEQPLSMTPFGNRVRIAGTLGIHAPNKNLNQHALRLLSEFAMTWLPGQFQASQFQWWKGIYPMSPDGLPLIGTVGPRGLFLNVGHGQYGWTQSAGSGKILADLIVGKTAEINLDPYQPDRLHASPS
ncbi:MAG: FAD-dependent oxidoreductase [Pigmentiphaga sp.]